MNAIRNILIATDFSGRSERAEIRAAQLGAEHKSGRIELVTVKDASQPETLAQIINSTTEVAQAQIAESAARELHLRAALLGDNHGVRCEFVVRFGSVAPQIVARADEIDADLVVAGAHGGNFFSDLFIGNTADKLVHLCRRPLLIVKNDAAQAYRRVLVPTDFSDDARRAAQFALSIAPEADITFLHAFEVSFEGQMQYANISRDLINDYRIRAREAARLELNKFIDGLNADHRHLTRVVNFGLPGPSVREHAKATKPDLIVMGKHGRSRMEELIIGSVTRDTIDQTECDVLIVPPGAAPAAA